MNAEVAVEIVVGDAVGGFHRVVALPHHDSGVGQSSLFVADRAAQDESLGQACTSKQEQED